MAGARRGFSVVFHSGSYDRVHHGLSLALTALAQGRESRLFFTYWSLEHLRRGRRRRGPLDREAQRHRAALERGPAKGRLKAISSLLADAKELGGRVYACAGSMGFMNLARGELVDEVDASAGMATFLSEAEGDQIIFV